jgi:hypothetical protein
LESSSDALFWVFFVAVAIAVAASLVWRNRRRFRLRSRKVEVSTVEAVRRGENIDVAILIRDGAHSGRRLKVGVLCIERYDVEHQGKDTTHRVTKENRAHEEWREVSTSEAQQGLSFVVPAEAPYTYAGSCLSFEWHAEALEIARMRPDAVASCTFEVRP